MEIGLVLPMATGDVERVLGFARAAEANGFDGVFAFDHLFPPGASPDKPSLEAYATLAAIAASTSRVRVGTLVTRASLRPVGVLAKQVATLDDVSGGRFVLGIGTGDVLSKAEHDRFGLPYLLPARRREHLAETIGALRALFRGASWPGGDHVPPLDGPLLPLPRTPGGPPIWVGGTSEGAVTLAADAGDGWNGWGLDTDAFAERARRLAELAPRAAATWGGAVVIGEDGREAARIWDERAARGLDQSWAASAEDAVGRLEALRDAGAAWAILLLGGPGDRLGLVAERVLPALRREG